MTAEREDRPMTEPTPAPERIWPYRYGDHWWLSVGPLDRAIGEYVRADLYAALLADRDALARRVEAARAEMERMRGLLADATRETCAFRDERNALRVEVYDLRREAATWRNALTTATERLERENRALLAALSPTPTETEGGSVPTRGTEQEADRG